VVEADREPRPKALSPPPEAFAQAGRWSPRLYFMTAMFK
jgi:hypothetical protein